MPSEMKEIHAMLSLYDASDSVIVIEFAIPAGSKSYSDWL